MTNDVVTRTYQAIDLRQKASLIAKQWSPRVVAELNDYQFKVVRIEGTSYGTTTPRPTRRFSSSTVSSASTSATVQ